ncbi:MAG: hypothetical protein ACFFE4_14170 [Candidatus Thorarchaeota archaeon]
MATIFIVDDNQSLQPLDMLILKEAGFESLYTDLNGKSFNYFYSYRIIIYIKFVSITIKIIISD